MTRVLFITWDGPQVAYLESLFLPIFVGLRDHGFAFDVLQFRWGDGESTARVEATCVSSGVGYRHRTVMRRGGAAGAFATALIGAGSVRASARAFGSHILMPRSLMPALAVMAMGRSRRPVIFDADGFPADERVEFGDLSATGASYRVLRQIEARMARRADACLVRTSAARSVLLDRIGADRDAGPVHVVVNGRDPDAFAPVPPERRAAVRAGLGIGADVPLIVYAGSVGAQYRIEESFALMRAAQRLRPDAVLLILTGSPDIIVSMLAAETEAVRARVVVRRVPPEDVPAFVAAADLATAYRAVSFSMRAVAPVKVAEYLLCGTPVVGTAAIGDVKGAVDAGVFLDEAAGPDIAARWLVDNLIGTRAFEIRNRARQVGLAGFSLERAVESYLRALRPFTEAARHRRPQIEASSS